MAEALGRIGGPVADETLRELIHDASGRVRKVAQAALDTLKAGSGEHAR